MEEKVGRKLTDYELHLKHLREFYRGAGEDGLVVDNKTTQFLPALVNIESPGAIEMMAEAMMAGWPVVNSYGATYGTTFLPEFREAVANGRGEKRPLVKVSMVAPRSVAETWFDAEQLGQDAAEALPEMLEICEGVAFVRGPASEEVRRVMDRDEIQVFSVSEDDPLVCALKTKGRDGVVAVRSSNMEGEPERPTLMEAADYAQKLGAAMVVGPFDKSREMNRERVWSQPILELTGSAIRVRRGANTGVKTLKKLVSGVTGGWGLDFEVAEEKQVDYRVPYDSPVSLTKPEEIRADLLRAAGL